MGSDSKLPVDIMMMFHKVVRRIAQIHNFRYLVCLDPQNEFQTRIPMDGIKCDSGYNIGENNAFWRRKISLF